MGRADQIYARPVADRAESTDVEGVRPFWIGLRLQVALVLVATASGLVTAALLQWELLDPGPTLGLETYAQAYAVHGTMLWAAALPLSMGVLSAIALPRALGIPAMRAWWLVYTSLALWPLGALMLLTKADPLGQLPPEVWALGLTVGGLAMLAVQVLWTLVLHRDRFSEALFLFVGLGGAAVLQLLAFARSLLQFGGPRLGISTLGSGLVYLPYLAIPVAMGIAAHTLERHAKRPTPARVIVALSMVVPSVAAWLPQGDVWSFLMGAGSLVSIVAFLLVLAIHHVRSPPRLHLRPLAALLIAALAALGALTDTLLLSVTVDVHLHDTYFAIAPMHLGWLSLALALALIAAEEPDLLGGRSPARALLRIGGSMVAVGLGGAFWMMLVIGQRGMPRRYQTYVPEFTGDFQWMVVLAMLGIAGACILATAFVRARAPNQTD